MTLKAGDGVAVFPTFAAEEGRIPVNCVLATGNGE